MNPKMLALIALLMLTPLLPAPAAATAEPPPTCDMITTKDAPVPVCGAGRVVTWAKSCPRTSKSYSCPLVSQMPPAEISCASNNGAVLCDAWPESDQLTYRYVWSILTTNVNGTSANEFSPTFLGSCTGRTGRIAVSVIAPDGTTKTASTFFACENGQ